MSGDNRIRISFPVHLIKKSGQQTGFRVSSENSACSRRHFSLRRHVGASLVFFLGACTFVALFRCAIAVAQGRLLGLHVTPRCLTSDSLRLKRQVLPAFAMQILHGELGLRPSPGLIGTFQNDGPVCVLLNKPGRVCQLGGRILELGRSTEEGRQAGFRV